MPFVRVAWLYGPQLQKPMIPPTEEDIVASLQALGTSAAHSLQLYSRLGLDRANDQEMTILGWQDHFHVRVVDNNLSEEEVYCFRGGEPGAEGTFMFPVDGDFAMPMSEVLTDRGRVQELALSFFSGGFQYDDQRWMLYAPE